MYFIIITQNCEGEDSFNKSVKVRIGFKLQYLCGFIGATMEPCGDEENNFSDVIDNLMNMFGNVMSKDVISAVVESCEGDLNLSVDAIMNMTNDGNIICEEEQPSSTEMLPAHTVSLLNPIVTQPQSQPANPIQPSVSYAASASQPAQATGAIPKIVQKPVQHNDSLWTNQIKEILVHHNQGNRILILMRGVPGSGKSHLARQIINMMFGPSPNHYKTYILSTDDYFMVRGQYQYDKYRLSEAHSWNHNRAKSALRSGLSPVIIDNTNVELWEMEPYLREGVSNGYIIEVVEPNTPWAKKAHQLVKRNMHNVPLVNIKRMLENYRDGLTGDILRKSYGLSYPAGMNPPVKRLIPPIPKEESPPPNARVQDRPSTRATTTNIVANTDLFRSSPSTINVQTQQPRTDNSPEKHDDNTPCLKPLVDVKEPKSDAVEIEHEDDLSNEEQKKIKLYMEAQKKLEEIEKVEKEWENGDNWDTDDQGAASAAPLKRSTNAAVTSEPKLSTTITTSVTQAKPQRKLNSSPPVTPSFDSAESLMQNVTDCQDWSKISMFMPPWADASEQSSSNANQKVPVETMSSSTCMEIGDTNVNSSFKVISATPRNINLFHISFDREKIPQKRMLDKSSMTNEGFITNAYRCPHEEKHFIAFRKLFKNIARSDLRDIFDKCCGDVNWSVEIVLDGMNNNQFKTVEEEEQSDPEEESFEQCSCLANYSIIPDLSTPDELKSEPIEDKVPVSTNVSQSQKKKREVAMSDETIQIKRQIEQNVVIADNHYSKHCLKIRRFRRGEPDVDDAEAGPSGMSAGASDFTLKNDLSLDISDDEDVSSVSDNDEDVIVNVDLGSALIAELDERFGRKDMQYPDYIVPRVSIPLSLLNEINALWMESLTFQLDEHANRAAAMMQQDEEFARQIAMKEAELSLAGKEPEVPDFKEIMDMDMALAIYQKDVAEWRNNMPTDLAAKMTRDKLYNLFPDVDKDTLTELLMAHDNNFNATVESLLMSTGRNDVLEQENGVNKFVVNEEMKVKDKILQEQKKELSEAEWPLLQKDQKVDMATIDAYREEADNHLARRNLNYQKAQDCIRRGMTQVANYYSELANFHKQKYEYANGLAVAALMQYHATNNPDSTTIDLHFLRVKEAKESLDVFIDTHISKLREEGNRRNQVLFFITGRGSHSQGRARIKPATIRRLKERGLGYSLKNPGLLAAKVSSDTKLTYQVSVP